MILDPPQDEVHYMSLKLSAQHQKAYFDLRLARGIMAMKLRIKTATSGQCSLAAIMPKGMKMRRTLIFVAKRTVLRHCRMDNGRARPLFSETMMELLHEGRLLRKDLTERTVTFSGFVVTGELGLTELME